MRYLIIGEIKGDNVALITSIFTYYNNWADAYLFGETADLDGRIPVAGKIYTCTSEKQNVPLERF